MIKLLALPTWEQCHERVGSHPFTSIERFVYDNEPHAPDDKVWREQLQDVLVQQAIYK